MDEIIRKLETDGYRMTGKVAGGIRLEKGRYKANIHGGIILMAHDNDWRVFLPEDFRTRTMESIENTCRRHGVEHKRQPNYHLY